MNLQRVEAVMDRWQEMMHVLLDNRNHPWPEYNCVCGTLLLAPFIRMSEPDARLVVVFGEVNGKAHCWLDEFDRYVVDMSLGQFPEVERVVRRPYGILKYREAQALGYRIHQILRPDEEQLLRESVRLEDHQGWRGIKMPTAQQRLKDIRDQVHTELEEYE